MGMTLAQKYCKTRELCEDLIQWLKDESTSDITVDIQKYIKENYIELYNIYFGYGDD